MTDAGGPPAEDRPPLEPLPEVADARILVGRTVLEAVRAHVASDATVEHGGILVGYVDENAGITVVIDSIRGVGTVSRSASLTFTHETWDHVNAVMARDFPNARMVGWYHSHPGFGIFLSDYDQFIHRNFFVEPWQIAYVDDPVLDRWGFFGWDQGRLVRFGRWGTWTSDRGDGPMAAVEPPAPSEPGPGDAPDRPPSPPARDVPVITVDPDPDEPRRNAGVLFGVGLALLVAVVVFLLTTSFVGGDDADADESSAEADDHRSEDPPTERPAPSPTTPPVPPPESASLQEARILVENAAPDRATDEDVSCAAGHFQATLAEQNIRSDVRDADQPSDPSLVHVAEERFREAAQELATELQASVVMAQSPLEGDRYDLIVTIGADRAEEIDDGWELIDGECQEPPDDDD